MTTLAEALRQGTPMNRSEARYAREVLEVRRLAGEILHWEFEPVKLRLAKATFYTPDFLVLSADRTIEFHEFKGHWQDDARVKIKVAASQFSFWRFIAVQRKKGQYVYEEIQPHVGNAAGLG